MSLTCSCSDDYEWYYFSPKDYSTLDTKYRRKCYSCGQVIELGAIVLRFRRWRHPGDEVEERIYGYGDGEVPMPDKYMCEECGDIFYSLEDLGFCINLGDSMYNLLQEYHEVYQRPQEKVA